ncbi:MFS transporter [Kiloniella litopenaei]|uniref:MFS transporter n=1 Tax=Kiloniella litopenaei TaxID=1549748 RepID=UPI003BAD5623
MTIIQQTYRWDCIRGIFQGFLDAGWMTFGLLIAIRVFDAPASLKAFMMGAGFVGYFLNPATLSLAARSQMKVTRLVGLYFALSALILVGAALASSLWLYAGLVIAWFLVATQLSPLMVHVYAENYPNKERGSRVAMSFMLAGITGVAFSYCGGKLLDWDLSYYTLVLIIMACAAGSAGAAVTRIPFTHAIPYEGNKSIWQNISLIWKDGLFGWVLLAWSLVSIAHWMMMPLRIEHMVDFHASNGQIALMTVGIPSLCQIVSTRIWGRVFDTLNFMVVRLLINGFFLLGFLIFFYTQDLLLLGIGSALIGVATGGNYFISNIWVTKLAGKGKAAAYMSANAAVSGLRGLLAPFLGYLFWEQSSAVTVAWIGASLIMVSAGMFLAAKKHERFNLG